jgi:pyruvate dehydrogenase E1 component beta subunit
MLLGMNQIANMVSCIRYLSGGKHKVPMVIRAVIGRGWGQGAQHSKTLHNFFAHIPGLKVVMPTTPQDAYSLLRASIQDDNPVIFLEHRWLYFAEDEVDYSKKMEIGKARIVAEGTDVTFICVSWMNVEALQARKVLAAHNISVEVVDISTISPLDTETLVRSVKKTGRAVVLDYDWVQYGLSGEIAAVISKECFSELKLPVERLGFQQTPCPTERTLEDEFYPGALTAIRTVEKMFKKDPMDLKRETFYSYETKFKGPF